MLNTGQLNSRYDTHFPLLIDSRSTPSEDAMVFDMAPVLLMSSTLSSRCSLGPDLEFPAYELIL